jgi:hypothetical protein
MEAGCHVLVRAGRDTPRARTWVTTTPAHRHVYEQVVEVRVRHGEGSGTARRFFKTSRFSRP